MFKVLTFVWLVYTTLYVIGCHQDKILRANSIQPKYDTCAIVATQLKDSSAFFKAQNDSLRSKLFVANFKLSKVKFYVGLVNKKPDQIKFLKGWINRAIQ